MMNEKRQRIRVRFWAVDTTSEVAPRLKYVYSTGYTTSDRNATTISVVWETGGMSVIANDHTITWLDEQPPADDAGAG
jgi:hypothetical protein